MKRILAAALAAACGSLLAATPAPTRVERGTLAIEGIPEIPPELADRTNQYQQTRAASLEGWLGGEVLITTRFAETWQVHHVATPGGARQQLTFFADPVNEAAAAPDGSGFLFSKDTGGNESYQIYHFNLADGRYRLLTDGESRNQNPLWSNKGDAFAFSTTRRNGSDTDVHVGRLDKPGSEAVLEREGSWYPLDWSPDDSKLLVTRSISANQSELWIVDVKSKAATRFHPSDAPIAFNSARFSRDGRGIYYTSDENAEFQQLRYEPLAGGGAGRGAAAGAKVLTANIAWDIDEIELTRGGTYIAYTVNAGGVYQLHLRNLKSGQEVPVPKLPVGIVSSLKFDKLGHRLAFIVNGPRSPSDVFSIEPGKTALTRWTMSETGGLDARTFTEPTVVEFPSFDGRKIPALYYRPAGKGPFPVLINIHGGPESQSQPAFSPITEFYVRELGLAVLMPNVRGSTGYGKSYLALDNGMHREESVQDVGALLDWVDKQPELDKDRAAVIGGSYGGFMVLSCMTHYSDRLRGGIDIVGISNFVTFLTNTKDYRRDLRRVEYGDERVPEMRAYLEKIAPTTNAAKITRPLFIAQGANDPRVPASEAEQIVGAVRAQGGEAWYLLARDEGHGFQKKSNRDYYTNASVLFLEKYVIGEP